MYRDINDAMSMRGQVIVVTGAGKGIGLATAKAFYALGCKVAVISRDGADLEDLESDLDDSEARFFAYAGDVSESDVVECFVNEVVAKFGRIDVLVNNAGMRFRKKFLDISYDEWRHVHDVNLGSTFLCCQAVGRYMVNQRSGRIINMASVVGTLGLPDLSGYASSKGAIVSLSKSLALEWASHNVNVNVIAPGFCETSYTDKFKQNKELYNFTLERTPLKRWGKAEDVANACLYLASHLADYVTGEVLTIDGGWSAW